MPQIINTNIASLNAQRSLNRSQSQLGVSLQRLSSGLRINSAKDDAAGLAISERFTTQIRGLNQARRNVNDGISLAQTAEASLGEINNLLQRGRELAVQAANATNSASDRAALQLEVDELLSEVDRISSTAAFNGVKLFDGGDRTVNYIEGSGLTPDQQELVSHLQRSWLEQSETILDEYFGITADNVEIDIQFVEGEGYLAAVSVSGFEVASGKGVGLTLNIDLDDFLPSDWPNGGPSSISNDRIIAHELTHAVMARSVNMRDLPLWFIEGAAEFIHGADARLFNDLTATAGGSTAAKVENLFDTYLTADGSIEQYSAGYAAVRYLHQSIIDEGGTGIKEVFDYLEANVGSDLDDAIQAMKATYAGLGYDDLTTFQNFFDAGDAGNTYVANLFDSGSLQNADTGAVGGNDADGGSRDTTAEGVVPDISNQTLNPLANFIESFPGGGVADIALSETSSLQYQVGANAGETINASLVAINAGKLGVSDIDLRVDTNTALSKIDSALNAINSERARLGALQNRFESASTSIEQTVENISASRSRILDADYSSETAALVRTQILQQAGVSVLSQANTLPQLALSLLS